MMVSTRPEAAGSSLKSQGQGATQNANANAFTGGRDGNCSSLGSAHPLKGIQPQSAQAPIRRQGMRFSPVSNLPVL